MMQRQLGHSHLGISSRPQPGLMLPPSSNNMRVVELQEKRRQEMEKRKRAEEERKNAAKASEEFNSSLFDEPTKIGPGHDDQVSLEKVIKKSRMLKRTTANKFKIGKR